PVKPPDRLPQRERARFVVLARLEEQKRVEHAIKALALVRGRESEARLDVYGDGSKLGELRQLAQARGVADAVTFHGFDPDARASLWSATALLLTSRFE